MIYQIGLHNSPINNIFQGLRRLFNPQGVARDELQGFVAMNPAEGQRIAESIRTTRSTISPSQIGDANRSANFFAPTAASLGLDPEDEKNKELLSSIEAAFPTSVDAQLQRIQTRGDTAEKAAEVVDAQQDQALEVAKSGEARARLTRTADEIFEARGGASAIASAQIEGLERDKAVAVMEGLEAGHQQEFNAQTHAGMLQYYESLSPANRNVFDAIIRNPAYFSRQLEIARLSLQERLALLRASVEKGQTTIESVAAATSLVRDRSELAEKLSEARRGPDSDKPGKNVDENLVRELEVQLDNLDVLIVRSGLQDFPGFIRADNESDADRLTDFNPRTAEESALRPGQKPGDPLESREFAIETDQLIELGAFYNNLSSEKGIEAAVNAFREEDGPLMTRFKQQLINAGLDQAFMGAMVNSSAEVREQQLKDIARRLEEAQQHPRQTSGFGGAL